MLRNFLEEDALLQWAPAMALDAAGASRWAAVPLAPPRPLQAVPHYCKRRARAEGAKGRKGTEIQSNRLS